MNAGGGTSPSESSTTSSTSRNELLAAAMGYVARGQPIFPCAPGAKAPLTRHGLHDASLDPRVIEGWWRRWPAANVGIPTGILADVVDVDVKGGAPGQASMERLRRAGLLADAFRIVQTASGGWHIYFAPGGSGNHTMAKAGIDYRGLGGYVIAPPSRTAAGSWRALEERAQTGVTFDWTAAKALLLDPLPPARTRNYDGAPGDLAALARWVGALALGTRNSGLFWAANRAIDAGRDPHELLPAALVAGLPEDEARRTIESAMRGER